VRLPDNSAIVADKVRQINFPHSKLTLTGTTAHVLPHLRNCSLLSLGQLADDGCITVLEDHEINIFKKKNKTLRGIPHYKHHLKQEHCILSGHRNYSDGLWDINIQQTVPSSPPAKSQTSECNVIIRKNQPKQVLAQYLHACAGFPPVSTFVKAIQNGNFMTFPFISISRNQYLHIKDIWIKSVRICNQPRPLIQIRIKLMMPLHRSLLFHQNIKHMVI